MGFQQSSDKVELYPVLLGIFNFLTLQTHLMLCDKHPDLLLVTVSAVVEFGDFDRPRLRLGLDTEASAVERDLCRLVPRVTTRH